MALIDDVKAVCDRLAPLGWRGLLLDVTDQKLDIQQSNATALKAALIAPLSTIRRDVPGFEDFDAAGSHAITPSSPSQSLLYHALASPHVLRDAKGALLQEFPTLAEIETVENFIFGVRPLTLAKIKQNAGVTKFAITVFATEYRCCPDTADAAHADLTFSRTGIARVGTARPKYIPNVRGFWPEDEDNPHAFRVVPVRLTAWLAAPVKGKNARFLQTVPADPEDRQRTFWIPFHKLFDGKECIAGLDLSLECSAKFFNLKLARIIKSLKKTPPDGYPYVIEDDLAELTEKTESGRITVVPVVQDSLVKPAMKDGKPQTFKVPEQEDSGFATYVTPGAGRDGTEIHPFPAYVHARTKVVGTSFIDLNDEDDVNAVVNKGNYEALLYVDMTGEGWVDVTVPALAGKPEVQSNSRPTYILLSAPDFFPSCGQRELSRWANSTDVPASFRDQLWAVSPAPLSETRRPANLQLPKNRFDEMEDTITAVVGMGVGSGLPSTARFSDSVRASTLPDDGAGEFAPGWDAAVDVKGSPKTGILHLAAYGLGSPFPEDAKLCAALSTFWPAVAPDVYRTMSMHTGSPQLRGTVAPLTDEEIGQIGSLPWDGVTGPKIVQIDGKNFVEMANFLNVDYVTNAVENRFSARLTSRISAEEYQRRVIVASRVHWVLSGGNNVANERRKWLFLSFRTVPFGDPELQIAQNQAGFVFDDAVYRVEACFVGEIDTDPSIESPKGPRFRLLPMQQRNFLFASAEDVHALRRRETNPQWGRAKAE